MLRLNLYCSLVPGPRQSPLVKTGISSFDSWVIGYHRAQKLPQRINAKAVKDEMDGGTRGLPSPSWDPGLEVEVPFEQRPVNEYSSLKDGGLYSWGELSPGSFFLRLGGLWLVTFTVLGAPIAAASFNPSREPLRFALAAGTGTLFLVSLIVLRIYLILARDRLLGSYKVKPVIKLLKQTLVGTGALLVSAVMLFIFATPAEDFIQNTFGTPIPASKNSKFNLRKEELLRLPVEVKADDDLAAAAAEAADGRPVYCRDRFYRALAGGQYCKWEDLVK
ncbi:protein CONSERVED IN THE GREEN LINEAGE AND DIATOMS 27, chloroplastic isoform X3 [Rhododendron vialii]|uniref:protein CONSERVED IN THE GREEN LINEAGE AND DIATOMS 27, chloroplastic isoform X3 n=1 Tax=Rhododendron vialii TaxID=182163 RepID=UPI00265E93DE|nr:protein CONSERVED IN THE GREEN LINEAGE AND DIATOMS 27, chloroplastic isoform X3 [Rhododendron vialii]